ncbi:MAG: hypothetical protein LBH16_04070 [Treponema sp.]|jgi:hypothetical protein|nr:hypothetical protein [Treponema sp.]
MKQFLLFIHCFLFLSLFIYADDDVKAPEMNSEHKEESFPEDIKKTFNIKKRVIEFGFLNFGLGFSNSLLSAGEAFTDTMVIDTNKLKEGFRINFDAVVTPFFLDIDYHGKWGLRFSTETAVMGAVNLSGNLLSLGETSDDRLDISAAAFSEARLSGFFHAGKIKLKIKPAVYYPLVYVKPYISYTFTNTDNGASSDTVLNLGADMRVYTAVPINDFSGNAEFTASPGADINLGFEYPLSEAAGLFKKFPVLNFGIGMELFNIPLVPSVMRNYMHVSARIGGDDPVDFFGGDMDMDSFLSYNAPVYGEDEQTVFRPFKLLTWIYWKPFGEQLLSVTPAFGFAVNPLYHRPFSPEGGVTARLNVANFFITELGINHADRVWKNSLDIAFNTRAAEFGLGVSMQSQKFLKSWTAAGLGVNMGLKFGW